MELNKHSGELGESSDIIEEEDRVSTMNDELNETDSKFNFENLDDLLKKDKDSPFIKRVMEDLEFLKDENSSIDFKKFGVIFQNLRWKPGFEWGEWQQPLEDFFMEEKTKNPDQHATDIVAATNDIVTGMKLNETLKSNYTEPLRPILGMLLFKYLYDYMESFRMEKTDGPYAYPRKFLAFHAAVTYALLYGKKRYGGVWLLEQMLQEGGEEERVNAEEARYEEDFRENPKKEDETPFIEDEGIKTMSEPLKYLKNFDSKKITKDTIATESENDLFQKDALILLSNPDLNFYPKISYIDSFMSCNEGNIRIYKNIITGDGTGAVITVNDLKNMPLKIDIANFVGASTRTQLFRKAFILLFLIHRHFPKRFSVIKKSPSVKDDEKMLRLFTTLESLEDIGGVFITSFEAKNKSLAQFKNMPEMINTPEKYYAFIENELNTSPDLRFSDLSLEMKEYAQRYFM